MLATGGSASGPTLQAAPHPPQPPRVPLHHRRLRYRAPSELSGFVGSTVPWYAYVHDYYRAAAANPRPTCCRRAATPTSSARTASIKSPAASGSAPATTRSKQERVAVLRTLYDVRYDTSDIFDPSIPHDNLHPSFGGKMFRSRGCQTVRGGFDTGHTGEWAEFRSAAGLGQPRRQRQALRLRVGYRRRGGDRLQAARYRGRRQLRASCSSI